MTKTSKYGEDIYGVDAAGIRKLFQRGEYYVRTDTVMDKDSNSGDRRVYCVIHEPTGVTHGMVASFPLAIRSAAWFNKDLADALNDPDDSSAPAPGPGGGFGF